MSLPDWPRLYGPPSLRGTIRQQAEDFQVEELLSFAPSGAGQHCLLQVQKRDSNTAWVAERLAEWLGIKPRDVGYAGRKDRHAVTSQWFSVPAPTEEPDWSTFPEEGVTVLACHRHDRKLRIGALAGNRFRLRIRACQGDRSQALLSQLAERGVPNYFGPQRFGREGANLQRATAWLGGEYRREPKRSQRSLYLSAARSLLFNQMLAERLQRGDWDRLLPGDVAMLDGSNSVFPVLEVDDTLGERLVQGDLHPTAALWGEGDSLAQGKVAARESAVADAYPVLRDGLAGAGLRQERRSLRIIPGEWSWEWQGDDLLLGFVLPPGSFATAVVREIVDAPGV